VSILTAPEWTSSCQSSGLAGILPFATHPPLSRFRVNGSHSAGWAASLVANAVNFMLCLYCNLESLLPFYGTAGLGVRGTAISPTSQYGPLQSVGTRC